MGKSAGTVSSTGVQNTVKGDEENKVRLNGGNSTVEVEGGFMNRVRQNNCCQ